MDGEMRRRNRRKHNKNRRDKKGPAIIMVVILVFVMALIIYKNLEKFVGKSDNANKNTTETIKKPEETKKNTEEEKPKPEVDKNKQVKGKSYYGMAKEYAYDTKLVRDIISGKKENSIGKVVFLTFDDGPNHIITPKILDVLKEKKVPATFFVVGRLVNDKTKDVLERELKEGHSIALHSYTHEYSTLYPNRIAKSEAIINEAKKTENALKQVLGEDFKSGCWRYPGGHMSWKNLADADKKLEEMGLSWLDWNCLNGDAEPKKVRPMDVAGNVKFIENSLNINKVTDVAVVLMHDAESKELTAEALPKIIDYFKEKGYKFGVLD